MNLYQLRDLLENSSAAERVKVESAGVTYRYRFEVSTDHDGGEQVSVDSHRVVAVYAADVNLTVAYGMPEVKGTRWRNEDLTFEWAKPQENARSPFVRVLKTCTDFGELPAGGRDGGDRVLGRGAGVGRSLRYTTRGIPVPQWQARCPTGPKVC